MRRSLAIQYSTLRLLRARKKNQKAEDNVASMLADFSYRFIFGWLMNMGK